MTDYDLAERATRAATTLVERSGMKFSGYTRFDSPAEVILRFARQKRVVHIVMGLRGVTAVAGIVMGSVALKVLQLASVPVTLVK